MAKILAPVKGYEGVSAGVKFEKGIGESADPYLISWFKNMGYEVIKDAAEEELPVPEIMPEPEPIPEPEEIETDETPETEEIPDVIEEEQPKKRRNARKKSE